MTSFYASPLLPDDLLMEIYKRAEPESVGRSKVVCKSLNSLLSSSLFVSLYHHHHSAFPARIILYKGILPHSYYYIKKRHNATVARMFPDARSMDESKHYRSAVFMNALKGHVCLLVTSREIEETDVIIVWNPLLGKYLKISYDLPMPPSCYSLDLGLGLVFHSRTDDLRVIRVWRYEFNRKVVCYDAYSVKKGLWRRKVVNEEDIPIVELKPSKGTSLLHWHGLMFDYETEEFTRIRSDDQYGSNKALLDSTQMCVMKSDSWQLREDIYRDGVSVRESLVLMDHDAAAQPLVSCGLRQFFLSIKFAEQSLL